MSLKYNFIKDQIYLYLQNGINLVFPLLVIFYIIPIVGEKNFGIILYYQAITSFITILIDLGFDILGIQLISRFNGEYLSTKILVNSIIIKLFLMMIFTLIVMIFIPFNLMLIYSLWIPLFAIFIPQWYFIGVKSLFNLSLLTFLHKTLIAILLLIFINNKEEYETIPLIFLISTLIVIGYTLLKKIYSFRLKYFSLKLIFFTNRYMFKTFSSTLFFLSLKSFPKVILGKMGLFEMVTFFDLGEKLSKLMKIPNLITTRLLIQKLSLNFNIKVLVKSFISSFLFNFFMLVLFNVFLEEIILLLKFPLENELIYSCRILSISVFIIFLNNVLGQQILIPLNKFKGYYNSLTYCSLLALIIMSILYIKKLITPTYLAFNLLALDLLVMLYLAVYIFKNFKVLNTNDQKSS